MSLMKLKVKNFIFPIKALLKALRSRSISKNEKLTNNFFLDHGVPIRLK